MGPTGRALLSDPYRNKGTAFTTEERDRLGLHGLLPPTVEDLDTQLERVRVEYDAKPNDLERHVFLRALQERNSVLFYSFLQSDIEALLPVVYTPTVGLACQHWSRMYRREHGLMVSWADRDRMDEVLQNVLGDREIDVVVATDGERILGLGDLGGGGMGIPIGKLALYTAGSGVDPSRTLPVMIDAGTDNEALLSDPLYLGWRHARLRGEEYDELIDAFVAALRRRFPRALLQWEDFAQANATRLLARHREAICSFNDDIQGTAAVTVAAIAAGMRASSQPIEDLRLVIAGAGSAGVGIANQAVRLLIAAGIPPAQAHDRCWLVDRHGLLHDGLEEVADFQRPFVRPEPTGEEPTDLVGVVERARPHALVGVTGQPGLFTEDVIRAQGAAVDQPIVLPLSNPTLRSEAIPADVLAWTEGRALVGTGSPFEPVVLGGTTHMITQVNNLYVFPGIGLGVVASGARQVSDGMLTAAATAVGELAPTGDAHSSGLLPPLTESRRVGRRVAQAVGGAAIDEGLADPMTDEELAERIDAITWHPVYRPA